MRKEVVTSRKYDGKVKMFYREAKCPFCGEDNWQYESKGWHLEDNFCEHLVLGASTLDKFIFERR